MLGKTDTLKMRYRCLLITYRYAYTMGMLKGSGLRTSIVWGIITATAATASVSTIL